MAEATRRAAGPRTLVEIVGLSTAFLDARGSPTARLDAELLVGHVLGMRRLELYLHHDRPLEPAELEDVRALLRRRAAGEPVAYLVGTAGFRRLTLRTDGRALVPRPETEVLVELALARLPAGGALLDLGTGSGAIALSAAQERPDAEVTGVDADPDALGLARENAALLGLTRVELLASDLYDGLDPERRFDVIAANLPYVADDDPLVEPGVRRFEPVRALFGGPDGLDVVRQAAAGAPARLRTAGSLVLELGSPQTGPVADALRSGGWADVRVERDLAGRDRFVVARGAPAG